MGRQDTAWETTNKPERSTALVAMELAKHNIDIAVLSETRFMRLEV